MEELTGYHFRPRAAEATLPRLSEMGIAARSQAKERISLFSRRFELGLKLPTLRPFICSDFWSPTPLVQLGFREALVGDL
jgi:hypothetical protein